MDESTGDTREDIKLPEGDIGKEIQSKFDNGDNFMVTIISAMGEEAAIATKAITKWCKLGGKWTEMFTCAHINVCSSKFTKILIGSKIYWSI